MKTMLKNNKLIAVISIMVLLPCIVWSEWLKKTPKNVKVNTPKKNIRGFYIPTIPVKQYPKASLLRAVLVPNTQNIEISWQDAKATTTPGTTTSSKTTAYGPKINLGQSGQKATFRYVIHRANQVISTLAQLDKSTMIAIIDANKGRYFDKIKTSGTYYYAISVVDSNNYEYFSPEYDQTYTADGVAIGIEPDIVKNIHVSQGKVGKSFILNWKNPNDPTLTFKIYESTNAILSVHDKLKAKYLALVPQGSTNFTVKPKVEGNFYYSVVSLAANGTESKKFVAAANTLQQPVVVKFEKVVKENKLPAIVTNLSAAYVSTNEQIKVNWSFRNNERPGLRIYQSSSPIFSALALKQSILLKTLPPGSTNTQFLVKKVMPENYYFAITSFDTNNMRNESLIANQNSLGYPIIVPGKSYVTNRIVYQTNIIYLTNQNTHNITNIISLTNTMTKIIYRTNTINISLQTNIVLTNTINVTNTYNRVVTNQVTITNHQTYIQTNHRTVVDNNTNKVIIKDHKLRPRPLDYDSSAKLRAEIRRYYRNESRRSRYGLLNNIMNLQQIALTSRDQSIKDQCKLYIGRSYYYLGQYRNAFKIFFSLKNRLPYESRGWINRCLQYMR